MGSFFRAAPLDAPDLSHLVFDEPLWVVLAVVQLVFLSPAARAVDRWAVTNPVHAHEAEKKNDEEKVRKRTDPDPAHDADCEYSVHGRIIREI